jgi:uncharacterized protein (TIGR01777 family)
MKVLVTGSTGLVGSALVPFLTKSGHQVTRLARSRGGGPVKDARVIEWDPAAGRLDKSALEAFEGVVHLAGENIAARRWSAEQKARIRESRVTGTRLLADALAHVPRPPKVLICASAIGYYGTRGDQRLTEESPSGTGFLAEVCQEWEAAAKPAVDKGIRVAHLRIALVLSPEGGALGRMLTPFRMGVGGVIGSGQQYMSWVAIDDLMGIIQHALAREDLRGPFNAVSPNPVTNLEFTKTLGKVLGRPTIFPMPEFAARLAFGEMADALLLSSARVEPKRLLASGYAFRYPTLEGALRHLLRK